MSDHFKGLLYQPAYDPNHLLLLTHTSRVVEDQNKESSLAEWRAANEFYFKSLASVQLMLNLERKHTDITSEQVGFSKACNLYPSFSESHFNQLFQIFVVLALNFLC